MTRISWDEYFLRIAEAASLRGTCPSLRVGAIVVDEDRRVISTGYNGSYPGDDHCEDVGCLIKDGHCVRTIHAEMNAFDYLGPSTPYDSELTVYCTHKPCASCFNQIIDLYPRAGFIFRNEYPVQCPDRPLCGTPECVSGGRCRADQSVKQQ